MKSFVYNRKTKLLTLFGIQIENIYLFSQHVKNSDAIVLICRTITIYLNRFNYAASEYAFVLWYCEKNNESSTLRFFIGRETRK